MLFAKKSRSLEILGVAEKMCLGERIFSAEKVYIAENNV